MTLKFYDGQTNITASLEDPYPVAIQNRIVGTTFTTNQLTPPGIVAGAAYADLDAIGTSFAIVVPPSGIIHCARYFDLDDEGLQVDLWLFRRDIAAATDNSALALSDSDLATCLGVISFTSFSDGANGQFSARNGLNMPYNVATPSGLIYGQAQARGALNIATGNLPKFELVILADVA